jgi:hypothetical protein
MFMKCVKAWQLVAMVHRNCLISELSIYEPVTEFTEYRGLFGLNKF